MAGLVGCRKVRPDAYHLETASVLGLGRRLTDVLPVVAGSTVAGESGFDLEVDPGASLSGGRGSSQPANLLNRLGRHVDIGRHQWSQVLLYPIHPGQDRADIPGFT